MGRSPHTNRIDIEKARAWRDQLWAEAVVAYRAGEHWWLEPEEETTLRDYQEQFTRVDCWEAPILGYLNTQKAPVTLGEVLWKALDILKAHQDPKAEARVKAIIERAGWVLDRSRLEDGSRPRRYVRKTSPSSSENLTLSNVVELKRGAAA